MLDKGLLLSRNYDFYALPAKTRKGLVGGYFRTGELGADARYFPVILTDEARWVNYGVRTGVIRVANIPGHGKYKPFVRASAFSPDDLDMDLDFMNPASDLFERVCRFVLAGPRVQVTYRQILDSIHANFPDCNVRVGY